ncbi:MAG: hypothetical protein WCV00_01955 [Verrucomicrobiia bacterium]|jgi:hypothetical protein
MRELRNTIQFLRREYPSILLVLISWIALFCIGGILEITLKRWSSVLRDVLEGRPAPALTQWVFDHLYGYSGVIIGIANCYWLVLVLALLLSALFSETQEKFRLRFLYAFVLVWMLTVVSVLVVLLALSLPFVTTLSKMPPESFYIVDLVRIIFYLLLIVITAIAIGVPIARRIIGKRQQTKHNSQ